MQILVADETDKEKAGKLVFFCIISLTVDDEKLLTVNKFLDQIRSAYNLVTLKGSRKNRLSEPERLKITEEIFNILKKYDVKARAIIIGDFTLSRPMKREELYIGALDFIIERWFFTLKKENKSGLVIFDTVGKKIEGPLRKKFYKYISEGECRYDTKLVGYFRDHIFPDILFSDDDSNLLMQAADLVGTSLNGALASSLKEGEYLDIEKLESKNKFLKIYWPLFMKNYQGKVSGRGIKLWN